MCMCYCFFFFNDTANTEIYTLSLHDALPILDWKKYVEIDPRYYRPAEVDMLIGDYSKAKRQLVWGPKTGFVELAKLMVDAEDRKSTRLNSSHITISYAVFCLKKKKKENENH